MITFDPYMVYPGGEVIEKPNFWQYLLAGVSWVIGQGSPTQHTVDVVSAYFPPILAALTVIPTYFLGRELLGRWAGIIAAGLVVIFSGEFLGRSILGNADYHVAEVLYTTTAMMFLLLAIKAARQRQLNFDHFRRRDWGTVRKPLIFSIFAGVFLGMYLLTWPGALLFVFIITTYFIVQFIIDHLRGRNTDYLCLVGVVIWLTALVLSLPGLLGVFYIVPLVVALLLPLGLNVISRFMRQRTVTPAYYPLAVVVLGLAGFGIFHFAAPSLSDSTTSKFLDFFAYGPTGFGAAAEMRPFLAPDGYFSLWLPWGSFTTSFFLGIVGLVIMIYLVFKRGDVEISLIVVWSLIILAATLGQRRYAYYLTVNMALLSSYFCWQIFRFLDSRGVLPRIAGPKRKERNEKKAGLKNGAAGLATTISPVTRVLVVLVVGFAVFYPNIGPLPGGDRFAIDTAKAAHFAPSDAWQSSLLWLKDNTPDPFGDPGSYYKLYQRPAPGQSYQYPESAYGVLAWWDYGYYITRIAHRLPNTSPADQAPAIDAAKFFLSRDEEAANEILQKMHTKYIIIDFTTAIVYLPRITEWAGVKKSQLYETYYYEGESITLFYPEYYYSEIIRLYNFDGQAVVEEESVVISYDEKKDSEGNVYKQITSAKVFQIYQEAVDYISTQETDNYRIVGEDPFISPVPLDAPKHYKLIHYSKQGVIDPSGVARSEVKIFEYIP